MEQLKINDKYEIIVDFNKDSSTFKCLRYGEEWKDLIGDNLILAMVYRIQELEEELHKTTKEMLPYLRPEYYIDQVKNLNKEQFTEGLKFGDMNIEFGKKE